jgi:hypothetical protein
MKIEIIAMNEPQGEGNGWEECKPNAPGRIWFVEVDEVGLDSFEDYAKAIEAVRGVVTP